MILCIDTTALKTSPEVQKDVNLEDLLNNHTKYYDSVEEAFKDKYAPLNFSVSVRSMYSNLVLQETKEDNTKEYYTTMHGLQEFVHKGYDLIMYLNSIGVMMNVDYKLGFDDLMMQHSQFSLIGLYNPSPSFINPIIYSHIIISDEGIKELPNYLKEGRELVPISSIEVKNALTDTLLIVKEEDENVSDNNTEGI